MYANSLAMPVPALFIVIEALELVASGCMFFRLYSLPEYSP